MSQAKPATDPDSGIFTASMTYGRDCHDPRQTASLNSGARLGAIAWAQHKNNRPTRHWCWLLQQWP